MLSMPKKCPSCESNMLVKLLHCPVCNTEIQGEFPLDRFSLLSMEQLAFLEVFIRCRGSLKDVGIALGISYPTARNRLDSLIEALDFSTGPNPRDKRLEILKQLKEGQITSEEALNLLQGGKIYE